MSISFVEHSGKSQLVIGTAKDPEQAQRVRTAIRTVLSPKTSGKEIEVVAVDVAKFREYQKKYSLGKVVVGQKFPSARAASLAVGAYLGGVSVHLSQNRRAGKKAQATIHGVTFKLTE